MHPSPKPDLSQLPAGTSGDVIVDVVIDKDGKIVARKCDKILASGADTLIAGDLGCLMNMAGKLQRQGRAVKVRHVAEVLAGMTDEPAIGEPAAEAAK